MTKIALVIEADPDMAGFLATVLKRRFDKIVVAATIGEVWQLLRVVRLYPDVLLINSGRHPALGTTLLRDIRQMPLLSSLPIVLILEGESRRRQCQEYQDDQTHLLVHPFTYPELNTALENALARPASHV